MDKLLNYAGVSLSLVILTLPITLLPDRYTFPVLGKSLPEFFLSVGIVLFLVYAYKTRKAILPYKKYWLTFFSWMIFCLIVGIIQFPFFDDAVYKVLAQDKITIFLSKIIPGMQTSHALLEVKLFFSTVWYILKSFFVPLAGVLAIVYTFYHQGKMDQLLTYLYRGIYVLSILLILYSIPEVIWLWTNNEVAKNILIAINVQLYDPASQSGWWPPLLWNANQLRSFCLEPSFFGIISIFLIPLIGNNLVDKFKWYKAVILVLLVFMLWMTQARTAVVIYLGESLVFIILTLWYRYKHWKLVLTGWALITAIAIGMFFAGSVYSQHSNTDAIAKTYVEQNITSVTKTESRSNTARFGNNLAMLQVGLDYPLTGVGVKLQGPYMKDRFPLFSEGDSEIKGWTKYMEERTFLKFSYPVLNEYLGIFSWTGMVGVILFLLPVGLIIRGSINVSKREVDAKLVILLVAFIGQLACMFSSEMFIVYPIILSIVYCLLDDRGAYNQ